MTYLLNNLAPGPGTHAIVIGVGKYLPNRWQLPDLDSVVPSANAFTDWLFAGAPQSYTMPDAPLRSVDVLLSPVTGNCTRADATGDMLGIERAEMINVEAAIQRWYQKGNTDCDNRLIFYFCGHGIKRGDNQYLLLEGFAGNACYSYSNFGIHFTEFLSGMDLCRARKQVYFLDCCRDEPPAANQTSAQLGKPIIDHDLSLRQTTLARDCPVICAAAPGQPAFGQGNRVSRV